MWGVEFKSWNKIQQSPDENAYLTCGNYKVTVPHGGDWVALLERWGNGLEPPWVFPFNHEVGSYILIIFNATTYCSREIYSIDLKSNLAVVPTQLLILFRGVLECLDNCFMIFDLLGLFRDRPPCLLTKLTWPSYFDQPTLTNLTWPTLTEQPYLINLTWST